MENNGITYVFVEDLHLDMDNPRLPLGVKKTEKDVLTYIANTTSLEDLMDAIAKNGFFPGEPLVAVKEGGKLVVVEGNRRLSAVKLINDPGSMNRPGRLIREISATVELLIEKLPVVIKDTREEVLPYLGFRHITGVKQWDPLSKARYMKQLFERTNVKASAPDRYKDVARAIGSKSNHIKRSLDALAVYEEVERQGFYDISELDEETIKFSVLSTALADERIANFIGTAKKDEHGDSEYQHPIVDDSCLDRDAIKNLTVWLYKKDESGSTKIGESRNLKMLGAVLDSEQASHAFMKGSSLDYAYRLSKGSDEEFIELLYIAQASVEKAASLVATTDYSQEALEAARDISKTIKLIGSSLKEKQVDDDEF